MFKVDEDISDFEDDFLEDAFELSSSRVLSSPQTQATISNTCKSPLVPSNNPLNTKENPCKIANTNINNTVNTSRLSSQTLSSKYNQIDISNCKPKNDARISTFSNQISNKNEQPSYILNTSVTENVFPNFQRSTTLNTNRNNFSNITSPTFNTLSTIENTSLLSNQIDDTTSRPVFKDNFKYEMDDDEMSFLSNLDESLDDFDSILDAANSSHPKPKETSVNTQIIPRFSTPLQKSQQLSNQDNFLFPSVNIGPYNTPKQKFKDINIFKYMSNKSLGPLLKQKPKSVQISPTDKESSQMKPIASLASKKRKRKFPGPAGLLPQLPPDSEHFQCPDTIDLNPPEIIQIPSCSQNFDEEFEKSAWKTMLEDLEIDEKDSNNIINRFNIAWTLEQASLKQLPLGKAPILCVIIKSISPFGSEARVTFCDKSGEITGSLHRKLMEEYSIHLQMGSVLVLQQVTVFSPNVRKHYLNVTPNNLIGIFTEEHCFKVEHMTAKQLCLLAEETMKQAAYSTSPLQSNKSSSPISNSYQRFNNNIAKPNISDAAKPSTSNQVTMPPKFTDIEESFLEDEFNDFLKDMKDEDIFGSFD